MFQTLLMFLMTVEGFTHVAYQDNTQRTWGYGTRATSEICITRRAAAEELESVAYKHYSHVVKDERLNHNQVVALASFRYNVGKGAYAKSDLAKFVKQGKYKLAAAEFDKWVYSNGKKLNGLVERRKLEKQMFIGE